MTLKMLTDRQKEILDFIVQTIRERRIPPTIREISDHFGIASTQGAMRHLDALQAKGWIQRQHGARLILIPDEVMEQYEQPPQQPRLAMIGTKGMPRWRVGAR